MFPIKRKDIWFVFSVSLIGISLWSFPAISQEKFPKRPITLICAYTAGGPTDIIFRVLAKSAEKELGVPIRVENRTGGAGTLGTGVVADAKPDGYTLGTTGVAPYRQAHLRDLPYNPLKDLTHIMRVGLYAAGIVVRTDKPWNTLPEFLEYAKQNPRVVTYGTSGTYSTYHLAMTWLAKEKGIEWVHVPFLGAADSAVAALGGHVTACAEASGIWTPLVQAGKMKLLLTFAEQRLKHFPATPTLKELGYDFPAYSWVGLVGPKDLDPSIVKIIHDAFKKALSDPAVLSVFDRLDMSNLYLGPQDFDKFVRDYYFMQGNLLESFGYKK